MENNYKIRENRKGIDYIVEHVDPRTNFGKERPYKTCDGKDVATMEEVMLYNKMFYERMMIKKGQESKIDPTTKFIVGSKEYNDYYYPETDKKMHR